jgi:hypothetical protein
MRASAHHAEPLLEYSGTLVHAAQARMRVLDGELAVPVLCMDIALDNALRNLMHVEQPFPPDAFKQAEAAAQRFKKGTRVTVQAPALDMRLLARNAAHIHIVKPHEEQAGHG